MFDPNKLNETIEWVRDFTTILRGRENFEGIDIRLVEFKLLQAFTDLNSAVDTIVKVLQENQELHNKIAELSPEEDKPQETGEAPDEL